MRTSGIDRKLIIETALPHLPRVSGAPVAPEGATEEWHRYEATEAQYKAVDEAGNLYIVGNPNARWWNPITKSVRRRAPLLVLTYDQAVAAQR